MIKKQRKGVFFLANILMLFGMLFGCSKSEVMRNVYLPEARFSYTINLDLPKYNALKYPQNTIYISDVGLKGIFITNVGNGRYVAWEAACPNQNLSDCQRLQCASRNGDTFEVCSQPTNAYIFVQCPCDGAVYNLVNGSLMVAPSGQKYPLLNYNASASGNQVIVSN